MVLEVITIGEHTMNMRRSRRPSFGSNFGDSLKKSAEKLKEVENALKSQMPKTTEQVERGGSGPVYARTPEPKVEVPPEHHDLDSEHDYDSPYGTSDKHNYHAVCVDADGKLIFLSDETKNGLANKINNHPQMDDVIAVYGGNLIYFEERRIIHIQ